jgi:hypothetical protein
LRPAAACLLEMPGGWGGSHLQPLRILLIVTGGFCTYIFRRPWLSQIWNCPNRKGMMKYRVNLRYDAA